MCAHVHVYACMWKCMSMEAGGQCQVFSSIISPSYLLRIYLYFICMYLYTPFAFLMPTEARRWQIPGIGDSFKQLYGF